MSENEVNQEINNNEAQINLGKNDNRNNSNFNKFFEETNQEIVIQTLEQSNDTEINIDDDTIYEIDVYNNLISSLSLTQQNNPAIQDKYLKLARHLINLKNKSKITDLGDIEDYDDLKRVYKNEFNTSWIIPVVLDKKKIYKKLDISKSDSTNEVIDDYINTASNKGIQFEDFFTEIKKEKSTIDEFNRDKISFKSYRKILYDIEQPYLIKKELKKKEIGYNLYLNQYTELLRYFNIDNKFWQEYINNGPDRFTYEQYDEDGKRIGTKEAQILSGAYTNIIGLFVLGSKEENILDALNGRPWFDRIRMVGVATKILKNEKAIVELKGHGLKDGDKVMILKSNSEPSLDGEYSVKVINENQFTVPVNTEDGKEGTMCEVFTTSNLKFKRVELDKKILELGAKEDYSDKYFDDAVLYILPEEEVNEEEWKQICKKVIPRAGAVIEKQREYLDKANTIDEMNAILSRFSIQFRELGWDDYFVLTEILDEKYLEEKGKIEKFNFDKYYGEIMGLRQKIVGIKDEEKVEDDIIFGNKYILSKEVIKYYGNYPSIGTDVDSIAARYNWIYGTPDYGRYYFLMVELDKIKEYESVGVKDVDILVKKLREEIREGEKELKGIKDVKNCEKRKIDAVKVYDSYNKLFEDKGKELKFLIGDYALIENNKSHENGQIFVWNGSNWTQNILVKSLDDLCLLGVERIRDFDLEKLHCLFKKACKNKKSVRIEKRIDVLQDELMILESLTNESSKDIERKLKNDLKIAELNLQIYVREFEDTRVKDTIEVYQQDYDPIYLDILKIPDTDTKEYLRNLLIKKDGIIIDKDIYSIRTGKKICCGHYYYQMKIAEGGSPEYSEKIFREMMAIYGTEDENGIYFCNHDGRPLDLLEYDTAEGLSKTTGEVDKQREVVLDEEGELMERIEELESVEREVETLDCSGSEIRGELLKTGFGVDQVAKAKDICGKINAINGKTGIILKKREFINIIVDVMQKIQKVPDFAAFKLKDIVDMKKRGIDFKTVNPKIFAERYTDFITIIKVTLVAARLLLTYQTLIPPQYPTGRKTSVVFEGFQENSGFEYMALLVEEGKLIPIHKRTRNGKELVTYLQMGKIKEEIRKSYYDLGDLASIKKMKREKSLYEARQIKAEESSVGVMTKEVPKYQELPKSYQKEVEKAKKYAEFVQFHKELKGREQYITYEIVKSINEAVNTAADRQRDDPKQIEMSCCYEGLDVGLDYYRFIAEKTNKNIYELLDESRKIAFYDGLFLNGGILMKHYPRTNTNFHLDIRNLGYDGGNVRKNLFVTYINKGIFRGEKHEFNSDGICLITGESLQDILKEEYSDKDEDELIRVIIGKTVKRIVIGGSKENREEMEKRDRGLVDDIDLEKLKLDSEKHLSKDVDNFVEKIGKLLNRSSNKNFMKGLEERVLKLGLYERVNEIERKKVEGNAKKIVELENEINRQRIYNLKRYINNYFRRYISIIGNGYDPIENIKEMVDMDDETSRELQGFIARREDFIKSYNTKRDADLFKKLRFNISAKVISNIGAEIDIWDKSYEKIEKIVNFNLSHLSDTLLFVLIDNLNNFLSIQFDKGIEQNKIVAQFIMQIFDRISEDEDKLDFTPDTFIPGDYRAQEEGVKGEELEVKKDEASRLIAEIDYKFKRVKDETDYEEVFNELEGEEMRDEAKLKFIKEYKKKFDKDPTDNEIIDYLDEREKEIDLDKEEEEEEWMDSNIKEEGEDVLEIGDGYGEMPQGGEGGEEGDF